MLSIRDQIYGVSTIWSEAKYNFAFWNTRKNVDWDKAYQETLSIVMKPMDLADYYLELMKFISLLNDGHSYIDAPEEFYKNILALPIKIRFINNKHIITNVSVDCPIPVFSEIFEINGMDFDQYMNERILPYCWNIKPSSSYEKLYALDKLKGNADKNAYTFITIMEKNKSIELLTSNGPFTLQPVARNINWSLPYTLKCSEQLDEKFKSSGLIIQYTKDDIAILTLPTFEDGKMPANFYRQLETLDKCKGYIIDIRNNGGGNSNYADAFSQAFIEGEFQSGKVKHAIHIGAYKAWGYGGNFTNWDMNDPQCKKVYDVHNNNLFEEEIKISYYPECPLTLKKPVIILENAKTGSSAENLLINFDNIGRAVIMGVPSYGTTGNPLFVDLPGGGYARVCTRRYTYPNDKEFINIGIQPHIYADFSQDDLIHGRDGVLDKGIEEMRKMVNLK